MAGFVQAGSEQEFEEALLCSLAGAKRGTQEPLVVLMTDVHTFDAGATAEKAAEIVKEAFAAHLPNTKFLYTKPQLHE